MSLNSKGVVLILTIFVILFMSVFVVAYLDVATTETEIMQNHKLSTKALYIAEAGIDDAIYTLRQRGLSDEVSIYQFTLY